MFCDNANSTEAIILFVTITEEDDFTWWGKVLTTEDIELFDGLSEKLSK